MSTPPPQQPRRPASEGKKNTPPASNIVTRNGARKAKIQTRAMSAGAKPSASLVAAKKKAQQRKKQSGDTVLRDHYQVAMDSKSKVKGPTGFVTEPRMAEHRCLWDDNYPECPERLIAVIDKCKELDLISQCQQLPPRAATKEEVTSLHAPSVYQLLETTHQSQDLQYLEEVSSRYDAVYIHPSTHWLALVAAGSTIDMVSRVLGGGLQAGVSLVRPPGHHAMGAEPCGYCFYNNVGLAAHKALQDGVNRILIVDWDVHHGQATQQMFYDDPRVVYFSIHRYEHGTFWPNLRQSDFHYTGCGRGKGYNFNVPLNKTGMGDGDYLAIWHQLLLPMALEFAPQLILVSAGYDAALGDEKGEMQVTPACYAHLLHLLASVCSSIVVVLEGGYCIQSLALAAALTLRSLLGHPPPKLMAVGEPTDEIRDTILNCIYAHKPYWQCYQFQPTYSAHSKVPNVCDVNKQKHTVSVRWEGDETRAERFATRDCYPLQDEETKRKIMQRLNHLEIVTDLKLAEHPVCYVYDVAMLKHKNICEPDHVECPERIMRVDERLRDFGLLDRMYHLTGTPATDADILLVHTDKHLHRLKELSKTKLRDLNNQKELYDSVYFHPDSFESAAMAAGCVIEAVEAVVSGRCGSGIACVRPPGHHADADTVAGFCLLNNVCIAARRAIADGVRKVLIVDWDVHHGNGTQALTIQDSQILYISVHRYDGGAFFPHSRQADYRVLGESPAQGLNVNIPWNKRGMGDSEYLAAFTNVVMPIATEFNPDLVLVSAGFDAALGDPLGGCRVSPECYARMTHMLRSLAGGRLVLLLEGGYNVTAVSYCMALCAKALLADPLPPSDPITTPHPTAIESITNVIKTHQQYWKSLKFHLALPIENVLEDPAPSRGLLITDDDSNHSISTLDDSNHSVSPSKCMGDVAETIKDLQKFSIKTCDDGIHCGTDDESPERSENKRAGNESPSKKSSTNLGITSNTPNPAHTIPGPANTSNTPGPSKSGAESIPTEDKKKDDNEKKTLVDFLAANMHAIVEGEMFAVIPLPWCPHLEALQVIPERVKFEQGVKCIDCDLTEENWVCLHCYITACSRHGNGHMAAHYTATHHPLTLSLGDLSTWCYACDAYVDHALLYDAKNNAHRCKFNEDMPYAYTTDTIHMH